MYRGTYSGIGYESGDGMIDGRAMHMTKASNKLQRSPVRHKPPRDECYFYHFFDLPGGDVVGGPGAAFDLRGRFRQYIGETPIAGKSVFDFGTASGFLAFGAETEGAHEVTAFDTSSFYHQQRIPFANTQYLTDKVAWAADVDRGFDAMHKGFWYMWHEFKSNVQMVYGCEDDLVRTKERFDVVILGAVMEHLSDPVSALGTLSNLAEETLILAFTPVFLEDSEYMKPLVPWDDATRCYTWWGLSKGLYMRLFENLGFSATFLDVSADLVENGVRTSIPRQTIVATRLRD